MTQALYSAKTGLSAGQTQVDVIANNVANINTTAYKTANVTFQTLFSSTLSSGSSAGASSGGTNPKQIGMGTQVGSITRNFENGSVQTTGNSHNLMISGNGYFTVRSANGTEYLTRDGNFSLDSAGNLVTASGCKVVGTSDSFSTKSGTTTVNVPTLLNAEVTGTTATQLGSKVVSELNDASISKGTFTVNIGSNTKTADGSQFKTTDSGVTYTYDADGNAATTTDDLTYTKLNNGTLSDAQISNIKDVLGSYSNSTTYYHCSTDNTYIVGTPSETTGTTVTINQKQQTLSYTIGDNDLSSTLDSLTNSINGTFASQLSSAGISGSVGLKIVDGGLELRNTTGLTLKTNSTQGSNFLTQSGLSTAFETGGASSTIPVTTDIAGFTSVTDGIQYKDGTQNYDLMSNPSASTVDGSKFSGSGPYIYKNGTNSVTYNEVTLPDTTQKGIISQITGAAYNGGNTYYKGSDGSYIEITGAAQPIPTAGTGNVTINSSALSLTDQAKIASATGSYDSSKLYYKGATDGSYIVGTPTITGTATNTVYSKTPQGLVAYEGSTMNESVDIKNVVSPSTATKLKDYSIGEDGIVTATYSDGSSLTVSMDANNKTTWKYTTADKIAITGSGTTGSDVDTSNSTLNPSSLILQLATVVNEDGLVATTDNMWSEGPNTGTTYYGVSGEKSFGSIKSGVLEGSNVDMTTELSNMITAQRAIQMNSRVFSTASSILQTIAQLGQ